MQHCHSLLHDRAIPAFSSPILLRRVRNRLLMNNPIGFQTGRESVRCVFPPSIRAYIDEFITSYIFCPCLKVLERLDRFRLMTQVIGTSKTRKVIKERNEVPVSTVDCLSTHRTIFVSVNQLERLCSAFGRRGEWSTMRFAPLTAFTRGLILNPHWIDTLGMIR